MEIIAKSKEGYLLKATENEVAAILSATLGSKPDKIELGQKIPGIDYAGTITKIKNLNDDYNFKELLNRSDRFFKEIESLKEIVNNSKKIEI